MNSVADSPTCLQAFQKYLSRIFQTCFGWLPCFRRKNLVHPVNTESGNNVFFKLDSHRRIRVIHIDINKEVPATNNVSQKTKPINWNANQYAAKARSYSTTSDTSENSLDEYWFTRWSRPLRLSDNCNCSFRQKWRTSLRGSKVLHSLPQLKDEVHYDISKEALHLPLAFGITSVQKATIPSSMDKNDCVNIEHFAENFVKDILIEAISYLESNINGPTFDTRNYNTNTHRPNLKQCPPVTGLLETCRYTSNSELEDSIAISCSSPVLQRKNNTPTLNDDSVVNSVQLHYKDNILNINTGCINPAFLDNSSDPDVILTAQLPARKVCKHVKRISKPLLYFLHSVGSSADIWQSMLNYFVSTGFEVVAPDLLGHGFSSTPDQASAYTFQRLLKDAVDIFDRFVGEHGRCVVIGHAYGCSLAAAVARYRTQVTHLVLISGGGPTPLAPIHEPALFPCLQGCLKPFIFCGCKRDSMYAPCGKHMAPCDSLSGSVPKHVLRHVAQGQDWPEGDSTFHRRILVPTLLVHGMQDPHVTLVQECEMERTIPRSFLELIPNAGHLSMLETPGQLSHMVHCFIDWWTR